MTPFLHHVIVWLWLAIALVWLAAAPFARATSRRENPLARLLYLASGFIGVALIFIRWTSVGILALRVLPGTLAVAEAGVALTAAGILFAVWARAILGANWSATVTIKQDHHLIIRGPYALVRHPIYTGLLLALTGSAIAFGELRGFVGVIVIAFGFWAKSRIEEKFMVQQFGADYEDYRRRVPALIPFLL